MSDQMVFVDSDDDAPADAVHVMAMETIASSGVSLRDDGLFVQSSWSPERWHIRVRATDGRFVAATGRGATSKQFDAILDATTKAFPREPASRLIL